MVCCAFNVYFCAFYVNDQSCALNDKKGRICFILTTHSTHFIYEANKDKKKKTLFNKDKTIQYTHFR